MVRSLIREHHYTPGQIDNLYLDDADYHGIEWLYDDLRQMHKELKKKDK